VQLERLAQAELEARLRQRVERRLRDARLGRFNPMADWEEQRRALRAEDEGRPLVSGVRCAPAAQSIPRCETGAWTTLNIADFATRVGAGHVAVDGRRERLYGKAGSGAGTPGPSGVRAVLSNIATIV
jgi:hypothetical protein